VLAQIEARRQMDRVSEDDPLFVGLGSSGRSPKKTPLRDPTIYRIFKEYAAKVGLPPDMAPHSARATAITKLLSDGMSYREVQEFSRHSSIQMVEHYDKRTWAIDKSPSKSLRFGSQPRKN
jgi:integrase